MAFSLAKKTINGGRLFKTTGMAYLFYAKLVTEYPEQKWPEYLRENTIGVTEEKIAEFADKLSKAHQEISEEKA